MANENIINWGLVASYWAPITEDADGNDVYGLPRKFRGNRAINFTQSGEMVKVYADGTVIYTGKTNNGYEGTIESTNFDEDFLAYALGEVIDANRLQVEPQEAQVNRFALLWEWEGDKNKARHCMFNVTANRPDLAATTKGDGGTKAAQYQTLNLIAIPRASDNVVKTRTRSDTPAEIYENWFNAVPAVAAETDRKITVTVTDGSDPISGAAVFLSDGTMSRTNAAGVAIFTKAAGTYDLFASYAEHTPAADTVTVSTTDVTKTLTLTPPDSGDED